MQEAGCAADGAAGVLRAAFGLAAGLKREKPTRTAAQLARILRATCHWPPSARTLQRHLERLELVTRPERRPCPSPPGRQPWRQLVPADGWKAVDEHVANLPLQPTSLAASLI